MVLYMNVPVKQTPLIVFNSNSSRIRLSFVVYFQKQVFMIEYELLKNKIEK